MSSCINHLGAARSSWPGVGKEKGQLEIPTTNVETRTEHRGLFEYCIQDLMMMMDCNLSLSVTGQVPTLSLNLLRKPDYLVTLICKMFPRVFPHTHKVSLYL